MMFTRKDPAQLQEQLNAMRQTNFTSGGEQNEWKLKQDPQGNGTAVIRFLPGKGETGLPFVKRVTHFFKGVGKKYYSENCTSTHGDYDSCPVCKFISENDLFNTDKATYQKVKRSTSFWANILVIKDPANPENEGKVFKYRFGQKIMDKINAMVEVDTSIGEVPVDVTCVFSGANFVLKVKKVGGHPNYDESKFQGQTQIPNIEDTNFQKSLIDGMSDLADMVSPDKFNSFAKNEEEFKKVFGTGAIGGGSASAQADAIEDELNSFAVDMDNFTAESVETSPQPTQDVKIETTQSVEDPLMDELLKGI